MVTDSVKLLREGVGLATRTWSELVKALAWSADEIRIAAMHQVGQANHDAVVRALDLGAANAPRIYPTLGNIGSCGVPVTVALARDQGHLRDGDRVALLGIGSGLNCAMLGMRW